MSIDNDNDSLEKVLVEGAEEMWNENHEYEYVFYLGWYGQYIG